MSEKKDFIEVNPSTIIIVVLAIVIIVLLVVQFSSGNGDSNGEDVAENRNTDTEEIAEGVFDDPNIVAASGQIDMENAIYLGDLENASYAIVEFSDFQCPFCQRHADETMPFIQTSLIDTGDVVYIYNDMPIYPPGSVKLAMAGLCVLEDAGMDAFIDYRELAYNIEFESDDSIFNELDELDVNIDAVRDCYDNERYADKLDSNGALGDTLGMRGVPGFLVGSLSEDGTIEGFMIPGAYPLQTFSEIVEYLKN